MKNITRLEARCRLANAGIKSDIIFGTSLSVRMSNCSVSIYTTNGIGQNMRITECRVSPLKGIGGTAADAVKTAKWLVAMLGVPAAWETGSIQHLIQVIQPDKTTTYRSCVSPYAPKVLPLA